MASELQIEANRENARLSSGPRTPEGKAHSSRNAVRHGLLARDAVLPDEDRAAYLDLLAALEAEYRPDGPTQTFLVHQLASAQWRLQRFLRLETGFFLAGLADAATPENAYDRTTRQLVASFLQHSRGDAFTKLARYGTMLNREYYRALKALQDAPRPTPPRAEAIPLPLAPEPEPLRPSDKTNPIPSTLHPSPAAINNGRASARGFQPNSKAA
jgi:hypothetical protein